MNVNKLYDICEVITRNKDTYKDLAHDTYLKLANHKDKNNIQLAFIVAKNIHLNNIKKRKELLIEVDKAEVNQEQTECPFELYNKLKINLTEIEKLWIDAYLDNNGNFSKINENIKISRKAASKRINEIKEKCKRLA